MTIEKDEFLNDDGKSAVMTIRRRSLVDSWEAVMGKARLPAVESLMGGTTNWLVLADHRAR